MLNDFPSVLHTSVMNTKLCKHMCETELYMLPGLKVAAKLFPQSLVSGTLPPSITHEKPREFLPATQLTFSADDIDALEMQLDNALEDKSTSSEY